MARAPDYCSLVWMDDFTDNPDFNPPAAIMFPRMRLRNFASEAPGLPSTKCFECRPSLELRLPLALAT